MYRLFRRVSKDGYSKKSVIDVTGDYVFVGEVESSSRGEAVRKWHIGEDVVNNSAKVRSPVAGDVVKCPLGKYFMFSKVGVWSLVSNK